MAGSTMDEPVPLLINLDALYPFQGLTTQMQRWDRLYSRFSSLYNSRKPQFVARFPGMCLHCAIIFRWFSRLI